MGILNFRLSHEGSICFLGFIWWQWTLTSLSEYSGVGPKPIRTAIQSKAWIILSLHLLAHLSSYPRLLRWKLLQNLPGRGSCFPFCQMIALLIAVMAQSEGKRKGSTEEPSLSSLVAPWLRICLLMQGTWVWPLVGELRSHMLWGNYGPPATTRESLLTTR